MQIPAVRLQSKTWTPRKIQSRVCERQTRVETEGFMRNNPVKYVDPDGRIGSFPDGSEEQTAVWEKAQAAKAGVSFGGSFRTHVDYFAFW